jgi:hypothetical protein
VLLVMGCASASQCKSIEAERTTASVHEPLVVVHWVLDLPDVRVHGPPSTEARPRAPPTDPHLIT